ncbi:monomeric [FeFe] hydrogenase [Mesoterricola sediminis]|uniref:Hydrogenase n=1 Tax=Mesoterricola sediminis TaxID=2927980 RepID=A0AA48GTQ7_9BACT|nr:monomeric [FeFe] hydrogenase [Mesoterricola sediminis]BDU76019.1 hydrogenase [Mesoterricola sediminis]
MPNETQTSRLRRELMVHLARGIQEGTLAERVDRLPLELRPRHPRPDPLRCCVHSERAILRYRIMALLGFGAEDETDELKPLAAYAREALARRRRDDRLLTVIDEACSACERGRHTVTDACRGCAARPCTLACPKHAIRLEYGRAVIDPAACVNCGKCRDLCAFQAIHKLSAPCERACPAGAIARGEDGKQVIDRARCVACGQCLAKCPFGAVAEVSELVDVAGALARGEALVALLAPALATQFDVSLPHLAGALREAGFQGVVEVAAGADAVARQEAAELVERLEAGEPVLTTSCCPAFTGLVRAKFPALAPRISATPTPLAVAAGLAEARFPGARRVFISPCVAKRREVLEGDGAHHVLTVEELGSLFLARGLEIAACAPVDPDLQASPAGRGFAAAGGVRAAVLAHLAGEAPASEALAGLGPDTQKALRAYASGKGPARFLEGMGCEGGCVSGPCTLADPRLAKRRLGP